LDTALSIVRIRKDQLFQGFNLKFALGISCAVRGVVSKTTHSKRMKVKTMNSFFKYLTAVMFVLFYSPSLLAEDDSATSDSESPENWVIEKIECAGNDVTSCAIIQNDLYLNPGDKVNEEEIENARLRMKSSGLFYETQISLKKGSERGQVILVVEVQERSGHYVNLGGSMSLSSGERNPSTAGSIHVGDRNLFGLGKRLDIGYSSALTGPDDFRNFSATYEDPNLFGSSKYFGALKYSQLRSSSPSYDMDAEDIDVSVGRRLFDFSYLKLSRKTSKYKSRFTFFDYDYWSERTGTSEWTSTSYNLEYGWNTKDDLFFPTSGSTFALGVTAPPSGKPVYYVSDSYTQRLSDDYFLNLDGSLSYWQADSKTSEVTLRYGAQIARYFTFQRQGAKVPDKMKVFAGADLFNPHPHDTNYTVYKAGISYLMDSFGELSFNLAYQGDR